MNEWNILPCEMKSTLNKFNHNLMEASNLNKLNGYLVESESNPNKSNI